MLVGMTDAGPQSGVPVAPALKDCFPASDRVGRLVPELYPRLSCARRTWTDSSAGRASARSSSSSARSSARRPGVRRGPRVEGWRKTPKFRASSRNAWEGPGRVPARPWRARRRPTYLCRRRLGERSGVYQASIGCPYTCNFCGVIGAFGSREKFASPARTEATSRTSRTHGMDAVHFYDNNFFLREEHAVELCERIAPLGLKWWCEARIDAMLRFSDATWRDDPPLGPHDGVLRRGVGLERRLRKMSKNLTIEQTLALAAKTKEHGILPEFRSSSAIPTTPRTTSKTNLAFIEKLAGQPGPEAHQVLLHADAAAPGHVRERRPSVEDSRDAREVDDVRVARLDDARETEGAVAPAGAQGARRGLRSAAEGGPRARGLEATGT